MHVYLVEHGFIPDHPQWRIRKTATKQTGKIFLLVYFKTEPTIYVKHVQKTCLA